MNGKIEKALILELFVAVLQYHISKNQLQIATKCHNLVDILTFEGLFYASYFLNYIIQLMEKECIKKKNENSLIIELFVAVLHYHISQHQLQLTTKCHNLLENLTF